MNRKFAVCTLIFFIVVGCFSSPAFAKKKVTKKNNKEKLQTRIDFGNAYIQGQSLKSGAVYLLQRKKSDIKSMLKYREHYRDEIMEHYDLNEHNKTVGSKSLKR